MYFSNSIHKAKLTLSDRLQARMTVNANDYYLHLMKPQNRVVVKLE